MTILARLSNCDRYLVPALAETLCFDQQFSPFRIQGDKTIYILSLLRHSSFHQILFQGLDVFSDELDVQHGVLACNDHDSKLGKEAFTRDGGCPAKTFLGDGLEAERFLSWKLTSTT